MIPLFKPALSEFSISEITDTLRSGWWGLGNKTAQFEKEFADYIGVKYAVAMNSATSALHIAVKLLDLTGFDNIITTPISFVSTSHAICYEHIKPVFADVDADTLIIDPASIEQKSDSHTKAIIPVHLYGKPIPREIFDIAKRKGWAVIEDCAHACGAVYEDGSKCGSLGDISCFSFHAVKNLPAGDGGMLCTNNKECFEKAKKLRWLGINKDTFTRCENVNTGTVNYGWDYDVEDLGFKDHMNDITASICLSQIKTLDFDNDRRRDIAQKYIHALKDYVEIPAFDNRSSYHIFHIKSPKRDKINLDLKAQGISSGVHYKPLYLHSFYANSSRFEKADCPTADRIWTQILSLPIFPEMTDDEIMRVVKAVRESVES